MGASPHSLMALETKGTTSHGRRAYKKLLAASCMKSRRVSMKRKPRRAPRRQIRDHKFESRVRTLKSMIPSREPEGLEGLFRETADYILALQMRVKVMQMMVNALDDGYSSSSTTSE